MAGDRPEPVDGTAAGAWIVPSLDGDWGGRVKDFVPQIYEAYARIFHPTTDENGEEVTWAEVARRLGTIAHPEMQWHAIVGSYDSSNFTDKRWPGNDPHGIELDTAKVDLLCAVLAPRTDTPRSVYFGMSTIRSGVSDEWPDAAQHEQTSREWVILKGPLDAIDQIALSSRHGFSFVFYRVGEEPPDNRAGEEPPDEDPPERFRREAPNLIWPEDRAWFVATEYDFDSTLVGGSRALIDALLAAPGLEVLEVDPEVSLTADADRLNPVPDPPPGWGEPQDPKVLTRNSFEEMFEFLTGTITTTYETDGVLTLELDAAGSVWRIEADQSTWPVDAVGALAGAKVERVEVDPETDALRLRLAGGGDFEIVPRPRVDDDPPSWRVRMPNGMTLKHGSELLFEFPDE
jgi:hypothetical protein